MRSKLEIEDVAIERAHRIKQYQNKKSKKDKASPRTIICKLLNYKDKNQILRKYSHLEGTLYYINEDFSRETFALRKDL